MPNFSLPYYAENKQFKFQQHSESCNECLEQSRYYIPEGNVSTVAESICRTLGFLPIAWRNAKNKLQLAARIERARQKWLNAGRCAKGFDHILQQAIKKDKEANKRQYASDRIPYVKGQIADWSERIELARQQGRDDLAQEALAHQRKFEEELKQLRLDACDLD
jgi:hypothetical protein